MTKPLFRIEMLPAREGDCLLVTYGDPAHPQRILIDGGRAATWKDLKPRLEALPPDQREFELLIVTHIDRDHIEGMLGLIEDDALPVRFKDIWFNAYHHLIERPIEAFGAVQGERLTTALRKPPRVWNSAFNGKAVCVGPGASTVSHPLPGGMTLTILSPDRAKLAALEPVWLKEVTEAGLIPEIKANESPAGEGWEIFGPPDIDQLADGAFKDDDSEPNGSSIAVLAEFDNRRALLTGDAHVGRLLEALRPLAAAEGGRLRLEALKLAHHGSKHNVSAELIKLLDCRRYLISTNGSYFKHPDREAVARVIKYGGKNIDIAFNYRTAQTEIWELQSLRDEWGYTPIYPNNGDTGYLAVNL